jgi:hypothetical protein
MRKEDASPARWARLAPLVALMLASRPAPARAQWALEGFLGSAANAPSTLTIEQVGQPSLSFTAHYATKPAEPWIYYAFRISYWWGRWGGMAGIVHHKIYLENNPPEVQEFRVTNGYNLVGIGPGYLAGPWTLFGTVGPVLSNPASTVRGLSDTNNGGVFATDNYLNGFNLQLGVNRRFYLFSWGFVTTDLRVSAAWADMEIANGTADTPNYAVHLLVGLGAGARRDRPAPALSSAPAP